MKKFIIVLILAVTVFSACQTNAPLTIYSIGDSTMANKKKEVFPETGWCQVIDKSFDETVTISNHAVNGRSTLSFINEGKWQVVVDSLKEGDYVFIQFGHNDQKIKDSTRYTVPFESYSDNLKKFITESREKGAIPILFTSIVRRKFEDNGKLKDTHGDYPVASKKVAQELNVPLVDLKIITENWINSLGDEASKKMFLWTAPNEKFPDGRKDDTHLSVEGANKVAQLAVEEIKNQKLKIADRIN